MGLSASCSQGPRKSIPFQLRKPFSFTKCTLPPRLPLLWAHVSSAGRHVLHVELNVLLFPGKVETEWKSSERACQVLSCSKRRHQGPGRERGRAGSPRPPRPCCDVTGQWCARTPADLRGAVCGAWGLAPGQDCDSSKSELGQVHTAENL